MLPALPLTAPDGTAPADPTAQPLATADGPPASPAPPAPDTKTQTFLVLDDQGDARLRAYGRNRIDECRKEMGLSMNGLRGVTYVGSSLGAGPSMFSTGINATEKSWAWQREVNQAHYDGDLSWRKPYYGPDSIFQDSNYTFNLPRRFARLMAAKLDGDQLPTDAFFAAMPQSAVQARETADGELAKGVEAYLQGEVGKSNLRDVLSEARLAALVRNDATVKLTWARRATTYKGPATVLVNAVAVVTGQNPDGSAILQRIPGAAGVTPDGRALDPDGPIRLASGEYVYQDDDTIPAPDGSGNEVLLKDPTFIMPPPGSAVFQSFDSLDQIEVDYEGLEGATVFFKDYLWWIRAGSQEQSDIHCHVYDESLSDLKRKYGGFATFDDYANYMDAQFSTSEASRARGAQGESEIASSRHLKGIHETYLLFDADGDGADEWVYWVYDYPNDKTIFVDYMKNHMKEPPFVMIPGLEKVEGRAGGTGVFTLLRDHSLFVDLQFNRINYKASKAATVTFANTNVIQECLDGEKLVLGSKEVYHIAKDFAGQYGPDHSPVFRVNLAEAGEMEWQLLEKMMQLGQLEVGILSAADSSASDLDSSKTATGVASNERSGDALQNKTGDIHASRFKRVLEMAVDIALENMPPAVAFYLPGGQQLAHLNREEIRHLNRDVRLLLTKARSAEALQRNEAATTLVLQYLQLPKASQKIVRDFFVDRLTALDVQDADGKLPDPTDEEIAAEQQAQAAAAQGGAQKPASVSVAAKLGDFLPTERAQIVQRDYQITPASPEEEQAAAQANAAQQQQKLPAHHPKPPFATPA